MVDGLSTNKKIIFYFEILAILIGFPRVVSSEINNIGVFKTSESVSVENGVVYTKPGIVFKVNLFGSDLNSFYISFSLNGKERGENCDDDRSTPPIKVEPDSSFHGLVPVKFDITTGATYFLCIKKVNGNSSWIHQGTEDYMKIRVIKKSFQLPLWLQIMMITILMMLSGMFSGLNLGLMSLDPNELKIVSVSGSKRHQKYAKKIIPVRRHGNFLLCTLLLGNTLVNSSFTILLDGLTSGIVAVIGSTLAIVVFGEIVPQSICSRYGLAVGAYTIYMTKLFMVLTFPISFPISKLLDCILGKELGNVYNKQQLLEMLKLQDEYNDLEKDEVGIISGALKYKSKTVEEVMTSLEDCFLLDEEAILDFQTMSAIIRTGYSRIPIYSGERSNIVAVLFVKDLAFVDPDDCIPLLSVIKFYNHPVHKVFDDITLDKILEEFKQGTAHLSVVIKINDNGEHDPYYESIGIVTLEDIIEEIIQAEIVDETDVYIDNVSGKKVQRKKHQVNHDFALFLPSPAEVRAKISPQLTFAIFQYLSTAVSIFAEEFVSRSVLKKLIQYPGVIEEKSIDPDKKDVFLYKKFSATDTFVLILQGRVEVTVGDENIVFEDGPFSVFGVNAITSESGQHFLPDYTVKIVTDVQYLVVSRSLYRSSIRATKMERGNKTPDRYQEFDEVFWSEMKKSNQHPLDAQSHRSDTSDVASEKGTPCKSEKKQKNSLLRRLKYGKRKDSQNDLSKKTAQDSPSSNGYVEQTSSTGENVIISDNSADEKLDTDETKA